MPRKEFPHRLYLRTGRSPGCVIQDGPREVRTGYGPECREEANEGTARSDKPESGKPVKAAITATARKLITVLNAMLAAGADFRHEAHD